MDDATLKSIQDSIAAASAQDNNKIVVLTAKVVDLQKQLDAATKPPTTTPPSGPVTSPNAASITPGKGTLYNKALVALTVGVDGKNYLSGKPVASSSNVVEARYYSAIDEFQQKNKAGQYWTQPADGTAGILLTGWGAHAPPTTTPPPVTNPPPVTTPPDTGFAPIQGKTLEFEDLFQGTDWKQNWQTWFDFGGRDGKDASSRCYYKGDSQPWQCTDPDYDPTGPVTVKMLAGGGIQLNTAPNPHKNDPKFPYAYNAGVIYSKSYQRKVNSYTEYDMTISNLRGSFTSGWSWDPVAAEEIDTFEQCAVNPFRLFWGAIKQSDKTTAHPTPEWAEGAISNLRFLSGTLWTPTGVTWYVNRIPVGTKAFGAIQLSKNQNLICNNVVGGWDGNDSQITPNTSAIVHSVRNWQQLKAA